MQLSQRASVLVSCHISSVSRVALLSLVHCKQTRSPSTKSTDLRIPYAHPMFTLQLPYSSNLACRHTKRIVLDCVRLHLMELCKKNRPQLKNGMHCRQIAEQLGEPRSCMRPHICRSFDVGCQVLGRRVFPPSPGCMPAGDHA